VSCLSKFISPFLASRRIRDTDSQFPMNPYANMGRFTSCGPPFLPKGPQSTEYKPLHPIGREGIAFDIGGESMSDGAGDGGVGGHQRDLADPLRPERPF